MKYLVIAFCLLLSACFVDNDDNNYAGCYNSSDYQEFECIHRNHFISASGQPTELSRTIAACTILSSTELPCNLATLPFLAAENAMPTKAQILSRLIVSHPWMAENFSNMLDDMPPDMYKLFASVTAIVIHAEIRPAFFWPATGAMYIDPDYLWITKAQYNTISIDPDYRTDYGNDLGFVSLARYTKDGNYAFASGTTRTETQTLYALSAVLFHELAHARDHFPVAAIVSADGASSPGDIANALLGQQISLGLHTSSPLQDAILFDLADVMYGGKNPGADLVALNASDAGAYFAADVASDDYAYVSIYEDTAMLFEETMMKIHYDIDREIVYATPLNARQNNCSDFTFDWTRINRFAEADVIPRARYVVNGLLPGHSHDTFLDNAVADGMFNWCQPPASPRVARRPEITEPVTRDHWH